MKAIYNAERNEISTAPYKDERGILVSGQMAEWIQDTYPCAPACAERWKDGQVVIEGVEYELRDNPDIKYRPYEFKIAVPIKQDNPNEDELWGKIFDDFMGPGPTLHDKTDFRNRWALCRAGAIKNWKEKYLITRKP